MKQSTPPVAPRRATAGVLTRDARAFGLDEKDAWAAIVEKVESNGMLTIFFPTDSSFIELDLQCADRSA
jgi:uncharacterized surface protein with fasciclin (FAS1) repeats